VAFSFLITFYLAVIESPILAWKESKTILATLSRYILSSRGLSSEFENF
jgi:hypothetical protein